MLCDCFLRLFQCAIITCRNEISFHCSHLPPTPHYCNQWLPTKDTLFSWSVFLPAHSLDHGQTPPVQGSGTWCFSPCSEICFPTPAHPRDSLSFSKILAFYFPQPLNFIGQTFSLLLSYCDLVKHFYKTWLRKSSILHTILWLKLHLSEYGQEPRLCLNVKPDTLARKQIWNSFNWNRRFMIWIFL